MLSFYFSAGKRMPLTLRATVLVSVAIFAACGSEATRAQIRDEDQIARRYFVEEDRCRSLLRSQRWTEAESICRAAARLAEQFTSDRELEQMGAFENVGHALMGQGRFQDALGQYARALAFARLKLTDADAEMGRLYGSIATAHHGLRDLSAAREHYRRAERSYQLAYSNINPEEITSEGVEMRQGYLRALRRLLEFHLRAAEEAGATAEADEVRRLQASLP